MYTTSHALLRVCEPRRDIHSYIWRRCWGASGDVIRIDCGSGGCCKGSVQEDLRLELARFDSAGMEQIGFEPGIGCTNCGSVCVRPLLGVSKPCAGKERLVGGRMSREGPRRRKYERVSVGLAISRHGMTTPSDGV
jgi:hypothetical protein